MPGVMIFSIPVDNETLNSAVNRILLLIKDYQLDKTPKLVVTINVDFLINSLSWVLRGSARHPELLDILRNADLVTADGMPIVWLSRLLNAPLQERVTGADLVPALARAAASNGHSLFFLGGKGKVGQTAADILKAKYPKLKIAGVYSPFVQTQGEQMLISEQQDDEIIKQINQTNPDILLVGFGNPKQELWFNRNRNKIKAAVTIGIGGTYEFIAGSVNRAPVWVQKMGIEWIYRIGQEPGRLWKRYVIGIMKLTALTIPLLLLQQLQNIYFLLRRKRQNSIAVYADYKGSVVTIHLSRTMNWMCLNKIRETYVQLIKHFHRKTYNKIIFDFEAVEFIDFNALSIFIRLLKQLKQEQIDSSIVNVVNHNVISLLKASHVWDLFNEKIESAKTMTINHSVSHDELIVINQQSECLTIASLTGRLDAAYMASRNIDEIISLFGIHHCILDLSKLNFLDSTGLRFFFYLQRHLKQMGKKLILLKAIERVRQLFEITDLADYFNLCENMDEAKKFVTI